MHKLTVVGIKALKSGMHNDGGGLYLKVGESGSRSWIFRFKKEGRLRDMGLGGYPDVSLAIARKKAREYREQVAADIDPVAARKAAANPAVVVTFDQAAEQWVDAFKPGWRSERTQKLRVARLTQYASPVFGNRNVKDIEATDVLKVLSPIWAVKTETAHSVRQSLEGVFEFAAAKGYRDRNRPNPATWRSNLKALLPARSKVHRVKHRQSMPWNEVLAFIVELRALTELSARALQLLILTVTRSSEVLLAGHNEVSGDLWIIPAERMKMHVEHRIPLVPQAAAIIENLPVVQGNPWLFPGKRRGRPLSNMSMGILMRRMGVSYCPHGFRSSFRDWAAECTSMPREIAEMCLAHQVGSEVERAYRRSDLLAKRRELLTLWSQFLNGV